MTDAMRLTEAMLASLPELGGGSGHLVRKLLDYPAAVALIAEKLAAMPPCDTDSDKPPLAAKEGGPRR